MLIQMTFKRSAESFSSIRELTVHQIYDSDLHQPSIPEDEFQDFDDEINKMINEISNELEMLDITIDELSDELYMTDMTIDEISFELYSLERMIDEIADETTELMMKTNELYMLEMIKDLNACP